MEKVAQENSTNQIAELNVGYLFSSMYVSLMASSVKLFTSLSIQNTIFCNQEISCGYALEHLEGGGGGGGGGRGEFNTFYGFLIYWFTTFQQRI